MSFLTPLSYELGAFGPGFRSGTTSSFGGFEVRTRSNQIGGPAHSPAQFQFHQESWSRGDSWKPSSTSRPSSAVQEAILRKVGVPKAQAGDGTLPAPKYRDQTNRTTRESQKVVSRGGLEGMPFERLALEMLKRIPGLVGFYSLKEKGMQKLIENAMEHPHAEHSFFQQLADAINSVGRGVISMSAGDRMRVDRNTITFLVLAVDAKNKGAHRQINHMITSKGRITGFAWGETDISSLTIPAAADSLQNSFSSPPPVTEAPKPLSSSENLDDDAVLVQRDLDE